MTKRQAARVAKAERLVREAIALLDAVNRELKGEFTAAALAERAPIVRLSSALERAVSE
jgi:hypothetical protein